MIVMMVWYWCDSGSGDAWCKACRIYRLVFLVMVFVVLVVVMMLILVCYGSFLFHQHHYYHHHHHHHDHPPLLLHRQEGMGVGLLSESLQKQHCLPPGSHCMHVFFTNQSDIMKLGLESSSLSGAFLETLPSILILFHFHLNYTEHILDLLFQL